MNPLIIAKGAAGIIVTLGTGAVVKNAIQFTTPETAKQITKIGIMVGGFVLSSMISDAAVKYSNETIDDAVNAFKKKPETTEDPTES